MNPLIIITAASFAVAALMSYLYQGAINDLADYRADVESAQKQLEADADNARLLRERIDKDTANGWAAAVAHARTQPVIRVRPTACHPDSLRAIPTTPGLVAQSRQSELGSGSGRDVAAEECETRLSAAVIDAAWIEHVKHWTDKQSRISQTPSTTLP